MAVSLAKGQKVSLSKGGKLSTLSIGLGWDVCTKNGEDFDLDASAFLLGANDKVTEEKDFIFYGYLCHDTECVIHSGDNKTGAGDGDDEVINVDLSKVPAKIKKIVFPVTIYDEKGKQNFGQVENAYIHAVDTKSGKELVRYDLENEFSSATAIIAGALQRIKDGDTWTDDWEFAAIGESCHGGLAGICAKYGVETC